MHGYVKLINKHTVVAVVITDPPKEGEIWQDRAYTHTHARTYARNLRDGHQPT